MLTTSVTDLVRQQEAGRELDLLFFWGHRRPHAGGVGRGCLSQWWPAEVTIDGQGYPTAEHYMMASKAELFGDHDTCRRILAAPDPAGAKALGRAVRGFDEARWADHREEVVLRGNYAKFTQHPELADYLASTHPKVLVEASPVDRVWGIGLPADDPRAQRPSSWRGLNLLGFAIMDVRTMLTG
jgi:ribA/ribD-fused uncharacterized protein